MKYLLTIILFLASFSFTYAQKINSGFQLHIRKTTEHIAIDGVMNEAAWQHADPAKSFFMVLPMDTSKANVNTEVRMMYDNRNLYIIAVCYLPQKGPYMVESLRRDFVFG